MRKRRPTRRDLLIVVGRLQGLIGKACAHHGNDRDPAGFEKGQRVLNEAFDLCVEVRGYDLPILNPAGPWAEEVDAELD